MIPPKRIEEIENVSEKYGNTYPFFKDIINEIFAERRQLVAIAEVVEDSLTYPTNMYNAGNSKIIAALKAWKEEYERSK